ncbi:MAG: PIN domain-containing protein [Marinoscillum sp.]
MTNRYKVLVDSSVWIEFFRNGHQPILEELIKEDLICTNEIILSELLPALKHQNNTDAAEALESIECIALNIDWAIIRQYQQLNLQNGINKVGIPDLIILQQVIQEKISLMSLDKHFVLVQKHFTFEIL